MRSAVLFVAHLGASEIVEIDIRAHRVVRTIPNIAQVHGVIVVPALHRVFATATAENRMLGLDEETGAVVVQAPTGQYPDGLAFDPKRGAVWTTNESGGSETVIDASSGAVRGTVPLGGEVGNVVYDPGADQLLVAVQGRNDLAVIDPARWLSRSGSRCRAANSTMGCRWIRKAGWLSSPVSAMPSCCPWTWPADR